MRIESIINLAPPASLIADKKNPVQTIKTNVVGSVKLLGLAVRLNVPIVQALTIDVYGIPEASLQKAGNLGNEKPDWNQVALGRG